MKTQTIRRNIAMTMTVILMTALLSGCNSSKKTLMSQKPDPDAIVSKVELKDFGITINSTSSLGGRNLDFIGDYSIRVKGDKLSSYLPYVGYGSGAQYKGGEGLIFEADILNYTVQILDEGLLHVAFDARSPQDQYRFDLRVYSDGTSIVSILPHFKQAATYDGEFTF